MVIIIDIPVLMIVVRLSLLKAFFDEGIEKGNYIVCLDLKKIWKRNWIELEN